MMKLTPIFLSDGNSIRAPVLDIVEPLSFWGEVDPVRGELMREPAESRRRVGGTLMIVRHPRGSSSSSAVLLELLHRSLAPAAIVLGERDAILALGSIIAREMGWRPCPIFVADCTSLGVQPVVGFASITNDTLMFDDALA